jgi:hypothetical protein
MLFPYEYVPHDMDKIQDYIDFVFLEVWCQAPTGEPFSTCLFNAQSELLDLMLELAASSAAGARFFCSHVEEIYRLFSVLQPGQIEQLALWYRSNNDVNGVCANDPAVQVAHYADVRNGYPELSEMLESFFKNLYSGPFLDLAAVKKRVGDVDAHYRAFVSRNTSGKCPFCGISDMQGMYHSRREAYDHYLPKSLYPFNSINFRNLVPTCHHCNSAYKTIRDPAYFSSTATGVPQRRRSFYPYGSKDYSIKITVNINRLDVFQLSPEDLEIVFEHPLLSEEVSTWLDVYGIEERYKAKCCSENDGKYWLIQILDEFAKEDGSTADFLHMATNDAVVAPYAQCNFLKSAFLTGVSRTGLFDDTSEVDGL